MPVNNFIQNIISKDKNQSQGAIEKLIKSNDINLFQQLCEKSDFIFPFIQERIINDFVKLINKNDLTTVFNYAKIYNENFENLIINSWLKFADDDLTDEILEISQNGTKEQKAYAAKYFSFVQDPLALDFLKKEALNDFEPLMVNCAKTLSAFEDIEILNDVKNIILDNNNDDFKKLSAFEFLCAYNSKDSIEFCAQNCFKSPFTINIISYLMDFCGFETIKNLFNQNTLARIYYSLIEAYPENITLDTISYYQILDFSKLIRGFKNQISNNILYLAKLKFDEFKDDLYSFDLDKNLKNELGEISKFLDSLDFDFSCLNNELLQFKDNDWRYVAALEVIKNQNMVEFAQTITDLINFEKLPFELCANTAQTLKQLGKIELIDRNIINKIDNINVKALINSLF